MTEIPEGFELFVDEDGDQTWLDTDGERWYVGPGGVSEPEPGWRPLYVGPPPPKPLTLEEKVRDLAARFDKLSESETDDRAATAYMDAADELRGLLRAINQ